LANSFRWQIFSLNAKNFETLAIENNGSILQISLSRNISFTLFFFAGADFRRSGTSGGGDFAVLEKKLTSLVFTIHAKFTPGR